MKLAFTRLAVATITADASHPNKMNFKGVLVRLDEPSTKPPGGAEGHRIVVTSDVARRRLSTLNNMGLNYAPSLDGHSQRRKVGTITRAWIEGKDLCVEGVIWKKDFPEAEKDLKQPGLGMSMELSDVRVEDPDANIWLLTDFCFTGATILFKDAAAYVRTQAIAAKAEEGSNRMAVKTNTKRTATAGSGTSSQISEAALAVISAAVAKQVTDSVLPIISRQTKTLAGLAARQEELELQVFAGESMVEDETADAETSDIKTKKKVAAAKKKEDDADDDEDEDDDEDDDDDVEGSVSSEVDKGDLEELGPKLDDDQNDDDDPGHFNEGAKNHGSDTTGNTKVGTTQKMAVVGSGAAVKLMKRLYNQTQKQLAAANSQYSELKAENERLRKKLAKMGQQITAASSEINRRSMTQEMVGLLAKGGINADDLRSSGTKLSVSDVDALFVNAGMNTLPVETRMKFKNELLAAGVMDDGRITRGTTH